MKFSFAIICSLLISTGAVAQDMESAHSDKMVGCYKRSYSKDHLVRNPHQKVKEIQISVYKRSLYDLEIDLKAKNRKGVTFLSYSESTVILSARPEGVYLPSNDVLVTTEYDSGDYYLNFGSRLTVSVPLKSTLSLYTAGEGDAVVGEETLVLQGGKTNGLYKLDKVSSKPCK